MASLCHVSVKLKKTMEKEVRKLKMCEYLLLNDLAFNEERFSSLLELVRVG